ncbi:MAG TPA: HPF/RaiA family ribosome-associated protein, partial [Steroidobacteraceae bacterium]
MQLQITFRNMDSSPALEARIRELVQKLQRFSNQIIKCQVVVEAPHHQHHEHGARFDFQVDIAVPGKEIAIGHTHSRNPAHTNAYVALRDAFRAAKRQLQDYEKIRRQEVKSHSRPHLKSDQEPVSSAK